MKHTLLFFFLLLAVFSGAQNTDSLLQVANGKGHDTTRIRAFIRLADAVRRENGALGLKYSAHALALADSSGKYTSMRAKAAYTHATVLTGNGQFDSAVVYHQQALSSFKKLNDKFHIASCDNGLGNIYGSHGEYTKALTYYLEALAIAHEINDLRKQSIVMGNIANCYANMDDGVNAMKYYRQSIAIKEKLGDKNGLITTQNNLGSLCLDMGNKAEAEALVKKTALLLAEYGDTNDSAYFFMLCGKIADENKEHDKALDYFFKTQKLNEVIGDQPSVATTNVLIGLAYLSKRDTTTANIYIEKGIAQLRAMNELPIIEDTYEAIADRYAYIGMPLKSYQLLKKMLILQDTLHSAEISDLIAEKENLFQKEKNKHEIDNLKKNAEIDALAISRTKFLVAFLVAVVLIVLFVVALVLRRNRAKQLANDQLEKQNTEITLQKKSITDSINYAKKIQDSILPPEHQIKRVLPNSFILYEPKDVVSGDFYWLDSRDNFSIFAAVDCTGHGVPGALMSVVGFNLLNQAVNEMGLTKPSDIIHHLDYGVNKLLRQSDGGNTVKDGMDLALCAYDSSTRKLQYAGVFNPAYIITKGEFVQLKPDKFPIGINADGVTDTYTNHEFQLYPGDMIYLFSDGYADQFGGPMGKKFKYTRFRDTLLRIHQRPCEEQMQTLKKDFVDWKGGLEQVDDILVIGVRVE
jgi:serine phosphatase RsbU (regulator of sigma subunit)/Tfp pilus assembly protein PilF